VNFWRLQCFVALAEARHFGRAADRLFISQPALSAQIRQLEEALGVVLVVRQPRVALTAAGTTLYAEALKILELVHRAERLVSPGGTATAGTLRLLYTRSVPAERTFDLIEGFRAEAPRVEIDPHTVWTSDSVERIRAGSADAAFVRLPLADPGSLEVVVLDSDVQCVALRRGQPLAALDRLGVDDLLAYPLVHWPRREAPGNHDAVLAQFSGGRRLGLGSPQPDQHRFAAVARSDGYALAHEAAIPLLPDTLVARPLETPPRSEWGLVWDGAASHDGARIAAALGDYLRRTSEQADPPAG
jgi:DNA-binding transcriptional LysR family regulator